MRDETNGGTRVRRRWQLAGVLAVAGLALWAQCVSAQCNGDALQPPPAANPARPTLSVPAQLPPTGYLQFEQGFNRAATSPGTLAQSAINQTTKLALTSRLLVEFLSQPYTFNTVPVGAGQQSTGNVGDLDAGVQAVVLASKGARPTLDVGYVGRVHTGTAANLDIGEFAQSVVLYFSGDLPHGVHYDSDYQFNQQQSAENSAVPTTHAVSRAQYVQTLALSRPVLAKATGGRLTGYVELQHATQPFATVSAHNRPLPGAPVRANAVDLLVATPFALRPNLVLDAAVTRGLTSSSTQWQGTVGATYLLPRRLWR